MQFFPKHTLKHQKILLTLSMIGAALYLIDFMHHYGIDVLMGDRVDTWTPLLKEESFWSGFFKQHGPHRLGLLFILTKIGYELGLGFDTRFDLFVNAAVIYSIIPLGLLLKYRLTQKFNYYDLAIPFAIVAPWQWATLIINPHIHVMLPLFTLLMALFITSKFRDNLIINLALIFLAFFSVYALFAAFLFSAIQFYRWRNRLRKQAVVILLFIVCLFLFYFTDFRWITLGSTGPVQVLPALKGPVHLVSYFFNVPTILGVLIILFSGYGFWKWFQENQKTVQASTVLFLVGSLSLFIFLQSVGRSGDDPSVYGASRYYTEMALLIWVIAIVFANVSFKAIDGIFTLLFVWLFWQPGTTPRTNWKEFTDQAITLKDCTLQTKDFESCNQEPRLLIHHQPEKTQLVEKWLFLEARKQAFINKQPPPANPF